MDEIVAVFYAYQEPSDHEETGGVHQSGVVAVHNRRADPKRLRDHPIEAVDTELELLNRITDIIVEFDPDILAGWEIKNASWGYCCARGKAYGMSASSKHLFGIITFQGYDFPELLSRAPGKRQCSATVDSWGVTHTSTLNVIGRYTLNVWRVMRSEHSLEVYTFENTVFHILRKRFVSRLKHFNRHGLTWCHRVPRYSHEILTKWYQQGDPVHASRMMKYMLDRTVTVLRLLDVSETVTKTACVDRSYLSPSVLMSGVGSSLAFLGWTGSPSSAEAPSLRLSRSFFASRSPRVSFCFLQVRTTYVRPTSPRTRTVYPSLF